MQTQHTRARREPTMMAMISPTPSLDTRGEHMVTINYENVCIYAAAFSAVPASCCRKSCSP